MQAQFQVHSKRGVFYSKMSIKDTSFIQNPRISQEFLAKTHVYFQAKILGPNGNIYWYFIMGHFSRTSKYIYHYRNLMFVKKDWNENARILNLAFNIEFKSFTG